MCSSETRIAVPIAAALLCTTISAQVTQLISVNSAGVQADRGAGGWGMAISSDGRYVVFSSESTNLVPQDTNGFPDVFLRDRQTGQTTRVSVDSSGSQADRGSFFPSISADGRYVAFMSGSTNLIPGDTNGTSDMFVHDCLTGQTTCVSVDSAGVLGNGGSGNYFGSGSCPISADGRFVVFASNATNLALNDGNGHMDVFLHNRQTGQTLLVSANPQGFSGNDDSAFPTVSGDGQFVAFASPSSDLVPNDTNVDWDVFVRDVLVGQTVRVSLNSNGVQGGGASLFSFISADGQHVAFASTASNLVPFDTNGVLDVFVHDILSGHTQRVSTNSDGGQGDLESGDYGIALSADGGIVVFASDANNLVLGDTNHSLDIFVHDRQSGRTSRASVNSAGMQGDRDCFYPASSAVGRFVVFASNATNLVPNDGNGHLDVFLRDRAAAGFTSVCNPGESGVIGCPCSNPPLASGRGCDNSAATGGAILSASGIAYLSMDSLAFTATGENPTALSIVMQGSSVLSHGAVYGHGVRCLGGPLIRRLFIKHAVAGSITAPELGTGDPPVSARSAAKGDLIQPGQSRWYMVYYRDPIALGGCPASSTFNATQTGRVDWSF
jgi:Tol biopolymer transport system component